MSSLRGGDAVRRAAGRLRETLARPGVRPAVAAYFDPAEGFAGMTFGTLGENPPDQLTADDLLAVSLLDITWRPDVVRRLLGSDREEIAGLLGGISTEIDLWQASDADLGAVDAAWDALLDIPGVGTASAAKLLARKRPRLCPITDKVVIARRRAARADLGGAAVPAAGSRGAGRGRGAAAAGSGRGQPAAHPGRGHLGRAQQLARRAAGKAGGPGPGRLTDWSAGWAGLGPVGRGQLVHDRVQPGVHLLPRGVLVVPADDLPGALLERDDRPVAGHHAAQLAVVEHQ